eukprot:gb/GECG01011184.1/.p1 GENE.gb/GECG01011184.1/~~gb/GECG01011184.1/.p1  ORF type:complete len:168 (+),score=25.50 gb/GECG01011184.1/:1-504(+)
MLSRVGGVLSQSHVGKAAMRMLSSRRPAAMTAFQVRDITYYTESHEYLKVEDGTSTGVMGITDHAQQQLGDIVFIDLPEKDQELESGSVLAAVESVKAASDVYAPMDCVVIEPNDALSSNPGLVNDDAEGDGWFAKLDLKGASEEDILEHGLMKEDKYEEFLKNLPE